jgi:aspartyl-tRNA(Asn)/glutamyl-tRNA(Gln) amidotransferase subunit C
MKITREQVLHVATLARLELSEEEVELFGKQLSSILDYVDMLERVDTSQVEPTAHVVPMAAPQRPDAPAPSLPVEDALANAPARSGSSFAVPKVIES